jgi:hypothetical protein
MVKNREYIFLGTVLFGGTSPKQVISLSECEACEKTLFS